MRRIETKLGWTLALMIGVVSPACGDSSESMNIVCASDVECPGALVCEAGVCVVEGCEPGALGCMCDDGDRCGRGMGGDQLVCQDGVCSSMSCPAGDRGCACIDGMTCSGEGDVCADGYCVSGDCDPGEMGCTCLSGSCDAGLFCLGGSVCVDDDGYEGGPCLESGRCNESARCDTTLDVCIYCDPGSEGCSCNGTRCNDGLACTAGLCVDGTLLPPVNPVCYSPCRDSADETRVCDSEGFLDGCIGDNECDNGSCVAPGESKGACVDDNDCPFYQACLQGGCYSNCENSLDCPAGLGCHNRVCRVPCESASGASSCDSGWFCDTDDGQNGYCTPLADNSAPGEVDPGDGFELDRSGIALSNIRTSGTFTIDVGGDDGRRHDFQIRKLWHEVTYADGSTERVEATRDPSTGELEECDVVAGECPLWWVSLGSDSVALSQSPEVTVQGLAGCGETDPCPEVQVSSGEFEAVRWTGQLEVLGNGGHDTITIDYVERPEGQWTGTMHYFGTFPAEGIDAWLARSDKSNVSGVTNGLVRRWGAFRGGRLSDGWREMKAVLTSTREESWNFANVAARCPSGAACYPYTNSSGVRTFVTNLAETPIPRGVTELPFVMNLRLPGTDASQLVGRIETSATLHYPGSPNVSIALSDDPSDADSCDPGVTTDCIVWLDSFQVVSTIGGRLYPTDGTCPTGFVAVDEPWLVDGFSAGTTTDESGRTSRTVCLDVELPFDTASDDTLADVNRTLAAGNPVPDGVARQRTLTLLDGALINQSEIFFLFQETFSSFVDDGSADVSAYGYVTLRRQPAGLDDTDDDGNGIADAFEGNTPPAVMRTPPEANGAQCDPTLIDDIVGGSDLSSLSTTNLRSLANVLLNGSAAQTGATVIPDSQVHYFCEETGLFDGGPDDDGTASAAAIPCPRGSRVVYFSTTARTQATIAAESCQQDVVCTPRADGDAAATCTGGTCQATLNLWENTIIDVFEPFYQCDDATSAYCDDDRNDLRNGKTFYRPAAAVGRTFNSLQNDIEAAFRYRTRFTSSSGSRPGFAPEQCIPNSNAVPYCYDPIVIEEIRDRVDCLVAMNTDSTLRTRLGTLESPVQTFLKGDFAEYSDPHGNRDGFERLYAELLVMQGDEALTKAFASRFDLAAVGGASFEGSLFEPDGIDLSGVAGFEMVKLYEAVQLYQMALDRLYGLGPNLTQTLSRNPSVDSPVVFLSAETVTLYLERLIRASTQKTRAQSEIAKRYQNLNRPDLARGVIERAYSAAYVEAVIIQQLMESIASRSTRADRPQIELAITQAQRRYRLALLDMRDRYAEITDDINIFGFAPDYIPFPALDASAIGRNAFEVMLGLARSRVDFARTRELEALASNRAFQTGQASFQAELVRIRQTYERQLADLCGNFQAEDGRIYPATRRYASLNDYAERLGDPCGRLGNGQIHQALVSYQSSLIAEQQLQVRIANVFEEVEIERQRVSEQCDEVLSLAQYQFNRAGETQDLQTEIAETRRDVNLANQTITAAADLAAGLICIPGVVVGTCVNEAIDAGIRAVAAGATAANTYINQSKIIEKEERINQTERETARWVTENECDAAQIDSNARTATLLLQLHELDLEVLKGSYQSRLALSEIERLFNQAQRLQAEQEEASELLVDVEAARTDPNVRVYRNDAIINADVAFNEAIISAYKATRVLEYYTSQSYEALDKLFLIRMITAGEYNLENYLIELENAFYDFEETYGSPDTRVLQLSLMDDILQIPTTNEAGLPYSDEERYEMLRERVQDVDLLDSRGQVVIPFSTNLERLSPLTRNHKIVRVEAEMAVTAGDNVGRLYLRPIGTGVIRDLDGNVDYHVFPERTAVLNPWFNSSRPFTADVYQNVRLRDRPLVNTSWELIFNQRDELDNRDIRLDTLTDVRLYIYYSDFTSL